MTRGFGRERDHRDHGLVLVLDIIYCACGLVLDIDREPRSSYRYGLRFSFRYDRDFSASVARPFLTENSIFGKCSDWLETHLKRCASTRAFEWCNRRVIWWPTSKVMAKKLNSSRVNILPIFGIAMDGSVTHHGNYLVLSRRCQKPKLDADAGS